MTKRVKIDFKAWPEIKYLTEQLKAAREKQGFTQLQVAKILGTAQSYVASLENGYSNPTAQLLAQLARLYKVEPSSFWLDKPVKRRSDLPKRVKPTASGETPAEEAGEGDEG